MLAFILCRMLNVRSGSQVPKLYTDTVFIFTNIFLLSAKKIFSLKTGSDTYFSESEIVNFFFVILYVGKHIQQLSLTYEYAFAPHKSIRQSFFKLNSNGTPMFFYIG